MAKLEPPTGRLRKAPVGRSAQRWTKAQVTALLGALGADATIESIADRTGHSVKAVHAKLARLKYSAKEVPGSAHFTTAELVKVAAAQDPLERATEKRDLGKHSGE